MKVTVVYKSDSEHASTVESYLRDFYRQTGRELETADPETPAGAALCSLYDVVEYPTIIAVSDAGVLQNLWRGIPLPTISEVSYYNQ